MRTSIRRQLLLAGLILATSLGAVSNTVHAVGDHATPGRLRRGLELPFLPNVKAHTVQEKVLLLMLTNGPAVNPEFLYHSLQEPPFWPPAPWRKPQAPDRQR